jgi:hypothetical protein
MIKNKFWLLLLSAWSMVFSVQASEQVIFPALDGFVRQQQGDFLTNLTYGELKKTEQF